MFDRVLSFTRVTALVGVGVIFAALPPLTSLRASNNAEALSALTRDLATELSRQNESDEAAIVSAIETWLATSELPVQASLIIEHASRRTFANAAWDPQYTRRQSSAVLSLASEGEPWAAVVCTLGSHPSADLFDAFMSEIEHVGIWKISAGLCCIGLLASNKRPKRSADGAWSSVRMRVTGTLDFLAESVLVIDARGLIVFANRAFIRTSGIPEHAIVNRMLEALPWEQQNTGTSLLTRIVTGLDGSTASSTPGDIRVSMQCPSGTRVFKVSSRPLHERRRVRGWLVLFDDVTALEEQQHNLKIARDAAHEASKAKSTFLANMSHEIRTPINGVMGTLELLSGTSLHPGQARYVGAARESAATLLHIINDILDFSKVEAGKLELIEAPFEVESVLEKAVSVVAEAAASKNLALILDASQAGGTSLIGDPDRLKQILINLTSNAIKFTTEGSVTITARATREHDSIRLDVGVHDTGVGIPPDRLDRLFKSFSQVDPAHVGSATGTGLGLAISKQLCELMHGGVGVESTVGIGSTFSFHVRLPASPSTRCMTASMPHILLFEPDAGVREAFAAAAGHHHVTLAHDERDLIELVRSSDEPEPALVIISACTWNDRLSDLARSVSAISRSRDIRLAAMTQAHPRPENESALAGVVDAWLKRTFTPASLLRQFREVLENNGRPASAPVARPQAIGLNVLVAEDHPIGQLVIRGFLESMGCTATLVDRGDVILKHVQESTYHAILMDCHLPGIDGFEATRQIRAWEQATGTAPALIIALTAAAMNGDRERCIEAGMNDYLTKPVDRNALAKTLQEIADRRASQPIQTSAQAIAATERHGTARDESPTQQQPLNLDEVAARCMNEIDMMQELLRIFGEATGKDLQRLESAVNSGDAARVVEAAHAMAGSALMVGAAEMARMAREIEHNASTMMDSKIVGQHDWYNAFATECQRCIRFAGHEAVSVIRKAA
jgi:signal transduction histidine kinase/CheY-like chemotaxis protein/HPt (histidine-containing phosphotransfer) domain-containing protein